MELFGRLVRAIADVEEHMDSVMFEYLRHKEPETRAICPSFPTQFIKKLDFFRVFWTNNVTLNPDGLPLNNNKFFQALEQVADLRNTVGHSRWSAVHEVDNEACYAFERFVKDDDERRQRVLRRDEIHERDVVTAVRLAWLFDCVITEAFRKLAVSVETEWLQMWRPTIMMHEKTAPEGFNDKFITLASEFPSSWRTQ
jgi:hypothetical protein